MTNQGQGSRLRRFWLWFSAGCLMAVFLIVIQAEATGGLAGLLSVGEVSALRPLIEEQLGDVPLASARGHDGQISYAIGLDLRGEYVPDLLDSGGYRYRRILLPLLSSVFGWVSGPSLLWGLLATEVVAFGLAAGSFSVILSETGRTMWAQLGLFANPGLWLSAQLVTVDVLALGLALAALALAVRSRFGPAVLLLALAALAKDQYLLVAFGLAAFEASRRHWKRAALIAGTPAAVLASWSLYLSASLTESLSPRGNLTLPFAGLVESAPTWLTTRVSDIGLSVLTLAALIASIALLLAPRNRTFAWLVIPWVLMAVVSSSWVWDFGNNSARVFSPLLLWVAFAVPGAMPRREVQLVNQT